MMRMTGTVVAIASMLALGGAVAGADKLQEFKDADQHDEGCVTIPVTYGDEREACEHESPQVHEWCNGARGTTTCGSERETTDVRAAVANAQIELSELKDKKSKAEDDRSHATSDDDKKKLDEAIAELDRKIEEVTKRLEQAKVDYEARRRFIEDVLYTLDQCIGHRRAVMNSFASAIDKVRNESDPPEIVPIAKSLRNKYEAAKSGHEEQIKGRTNATNNCKAWRP